MFVNVKRKKKKTGSVNSAKATIDGIVFASKIEAYTYRQLKAAGLEFSYEGDSFTLLDSFRYDGVQFKSVKSKKDLVDYSGKLTRAITYKPDFVSHKHKFVIEVKGFIPSQHTFPLRWKLFLRYLMDNDMGDYRLYIPRNQSQVNEMITIISNDR
jgi:hypothetical protein